MRKKSRYILFLCVTTVFVSIFLSACGSGSSVVGTWVVDEYDNGEETISTDEISELYGITAGEFNKYSLIFTKSGNVTLIRPDFSGGTSELQLAYTVQDGLIEVYDPDDSTDYELYDYQNNRITINLNDDLTVIFKKK